MKIQSTFIFLKELSFHAFHGVSEQERCVGNVFIIDIKLKVDFQKALLSDSVLDTVSYADVFQSVAEEMKIPSLLLEHVCGRITKRLFNDFSAIEELDIRLQKQNPPMGADIVSAGVEMHCTR